MKEILTQLIQRAEKLKVEIEKLERLECEYEETLTFGKHGEVHDQKELVEFLKFKLKNTVRLLGERYEHQ